MKARRGVKKRRKNEKRKTRSMQSNCAPMRNGQALQPLHATASIQLWQPPHLQQPPPTGTRLVQSQLPAAWSHLPPELTPAYAPASHPSSICIPKQEPFGWIVQLSVHRRVSPCLVHMGDSWGVTKVIQPWVALRSLSLCRDDSRFTGAVWTA